MEEKKARKIFRLYHRLREAGAEVLCVSRVHPDHLEEGFGIPRESTLWLSNKVGDRNINPMNVGILTDRLIRFLEGSERGAVLIEGVEYLVMQNDFDKVLKMVNFLYESVAITKGTLVISIDPRAFNQKELAFLERSATVVEEGDELFVP
ncbi:MAG: DUF835 domain-containing protein [Methanomassiliicoccales archaeon]